MRRSSLTVLGLLVLAPSLLEAQRRTYEDDVDGYEACRDIWREYGRSMNGRTRAVYCEIRDVGVAPKPAQIDFDGTRWAGVRVRGERRNDVRVRLVIQAQGRTVAEARELAKDVKLDLSAAPWRVEGLRRDRGDNRYDDDDREAVFAIVAIDAPQETNLRLRTTYASLDVENVSGRMDLNAAYGPINLRDVGGDVRARVDYGPIVVDLAGAKWQGAGLDAESAYGPVTLRVPRNFGAELEIGADHGPIDVDFPLTLRRFDRSLIETKLGDGGPRVRAVARYGPMSLKMAR
jgi:hypothetical protein